MANGFLRVGTLGRVDLRLHWAAPIAMLVWVLVFGRAGTWAEVSAAVVCIYLIHGLGHFAVARAVRFKVHRLEMGPIGVRAEYSGRGSRTSHMWVAFGGVMAHGVVAMLLFMFPSESSGWTAAMFTNLGMGMVNLIPMGALDGADGWSLAARSGRHAAHRSDSNHPAATRSRLLREVDSQLGHSPSARPSRPAGQGVLELSGVEDVPQELVEQADFLMNQARRDAKAKVRNRTGEAGSSGPSEE